MPYKDKATQKKKFHENYMKNREQRLAQQRAYHFANHDKALARRRLYYREHKAKILAHMKEQYRARQQEFRELKLETYNAYGGAFCRCCGDTHIEFLSIDHIAGGGAKHRKANGIAGGVDLYQWLKEHNFPSGFRVLCMNCNCSLGRYGYCPHGNVVRETLIEKPIVKEGSNLPLFSWEGV